MSLGRLDELPRAALAHVSTPLEPLPNLTRQFEFYVGEALSQVADVLLITGATQSNNELVVPSGSGATHAGFLVGLRALGCNIPVKGICVRRTRDLQVPRLKQRCAEISDVLGIENPVRDDDIDVNDDVLAPGYGKMNDAVAEAIQMMAQGEGIILDPVYSGRSMAGFLQRARVSGAENQLLFLHTGGQPAIFGYEDDLNPLLSDLPA